MNITPFEMYLITTLDSICFATTFIAIASALLSIFLYMERYDRWNYPFTVFIISFFIAIFIPSTRNMAAILIIPRIANSEKAQTISNEVYDLAVEWMKELKPAKKEGAK